VLEIKLLREFVTEAKSIAFLHSSTNLVSGYDRILNDVKLAADTLGVELLAVGARVARQRSFPVTVTTIVKSYRDRIGVARAKGAYNLLPQ
jgi:hypothetical protein